ncbi:MAG TPA: acetaldehyde dehydrogenase (acetylating) [Atribacterota bacterium]|nr:acetaldehyde dehydrogenase (acetylating) [Atribacterota bacterium]
MNERIDVAIIGPGNIGTDLIYKIQKRSKYMNLKLMIGRRVSKGLERAEKLGIDVSSMGINAIKGKGIQIAFDATTARGHKSSWPVLKEEGVIAIDLTPAAIGPYVSPVVNLKQYINEQNINLITCGGQATIPIVAAVSQVAKVSYGEIVATIASKSAGPGTRQSIDEFTQTTARGIEIVGGAKKGKAIIILNPAEPPIMMRNTIFIILEDNKVDKEAITKSIKEMAKKVQQYVPGYKILLGPLFDGNMVTVGTEVKGAGDFLPDYAGNLDIETSAAVAIGEIIAEKLIREKEVRNDEK